MNERRRPSRRGRGPRPFARPRTEILDEPTPYRETPADNEGGNAGNPAGAGTTAAPDRDWNTGGAPPPPAAEGGDSGSSVAPGGPAAAVPAPSPGASAAPPGMANGGSVANSATDAVVGGGPPNVAAGPAAPAGGPGQHHGGAPHRDRGDGGPYGQGQHQNGRRGRRNRGRGRGGGGREHQQSAPPAPITPTGTTQGWFDAARDGGYIRRPQNSYLAESGDAFVPPHLVRQVGLRRGDAVEAAVGRDGRGRVTVVEVTSVNATSPLSAQSRPEFASLPASYPERKLVLETGRPAKGGPELIRRAVDLITPVGYGQRGLIVAPARAGKTTLLHAITEGVAVNHPEAVLLILLVDERPEEVSEAISWGVGEVISSSFDQPAQRHVEVTEIVLEHARRLVEQGKDVVIVLDSLTRMARAHNTAERGTGRTLSGGLDAQAMAKPKAFFGSARAVAPAAGGGSLTIVATALVETGSRMDDVIFEEFKGTGNLELKLDRGLAEKRIYPAIDIATSGTRREEKLFRPDQLDAVYALRRGLSQMPPQAAMEWLIKRIAATPSNDVLLAGLLRD
jgi:transcription termination factor Rho